MLERMMDSSSAIEFKINACLEVVQLFQPLLDSYFLDFYVNNLWDTLPSSWQQLECLDLEKFSGLLVVESDGTKIVSDYVCILPLSILALKVLSKPVCVPRNKSSPLDSSKSQPKLPPKLRKEIVKKVKPPAFVCVFCRVNICLC